MHNGLLESMGRNYDITLWVGGKMGTHMNWEDLISLVTAVY